MGELPLLERILDAHVKTELLLLVGDRKPVFDEDDPRADQHAFKFGDGAEELLHLLLRAEAHDAFHARAIVPAAVEQHDLTCGRQMADIALEIPLRLFAAIGRGQGGHAADTRIEPLGDALDRAALAGGIAPLEQDDNLEALALHPVLKADQFILQGEEFAEIGPAFEAPALALPVETALIEGHLQFFIETVGEFGLDALDIGIEISHAGQPSRPLCLPRDKDRTKSFLPQGCAAQSMANSSAMAEWLWISRWI
jgi:hypothetical protein